jgi:hypothetical protein
MGIDGAQAREERKAVTGNAGVLLLVLTRNVFDVRRSYAKTATGFKWLLPNAAGSKNYRWQTKCATLPPPLAARWQIIRRCPEATYSPHYIAYAPYGQSINVNAAVAESYGFACPCFPPRKFLVNQK